MATDGLPLPNRSDGLDDHPLESVVAAALERTNSAKITPEAVLDAIALYEPPPLKRGTLRPYVDLADGGEYADVLDRAVKMLLYAPEVIVWGPVELLEAGGLDEALNVIPALVDVWDLIADGSLLLRELDRPLGRPASFGNPDSLRLDTPEVYEPLGFTDRELNHWIDQVTVLEQWPGCTTPWFLNERQSLVAVDLMKRASVLADRRALQVPKLAALELPALKMHVPDVVAVRRSSEAFAEWRQRLGVALSQVELLPEGDGWQLQARAIIADELTPYTERVRAEASRSTALSKAVVGMKEMAISGIGGAVGEIIGGPTGAIAGLGGAGLATLVAGMSDWVKARRDAAPKRAVLQLSMIFDDRPA
ncbi:hypothetical protein [Nocardioides sp.]|uniref:hypothetical protein n=1 Tax=Nocardioides sp. TaxID=35761 RepID=UPI003D1246F0